MGTAEQRVWQPISDVPGYLLSEPRPTGLASLEPIWRETRARLEHSKGVQHFNTRLARQWAIETGLIERLYTLDRGVTNLLVEHGFHEALIGHGATDLPSHDVIAMLQAHSEALEGLFTFIRGDRPLSTSYIKELHATLTKAQKSVHAVDSLGRTVETELLRGDWKRRPNNPRREDGTTFIYCPPEQVPGQMETLVRLYREHKDMPPEVEAAWLHHRFTQIHPFQDGNGRVARALATLIFLRAGLFPLVVDRDQRSTYITRLEAADGGDLRPLVLLFADIEKQALLRAIGLAEDTIQTASGLSAAVQAVVQSAQRSYAEPAAAVADAARTADELADTAYARLRDIGDVFNRDFAEAGVPMRATISRSTEENAYYYAAQVTKIANERFSYYVNLHAPRQWVRLHLRDGIRADLIFSFHSVGYQARGAMACLSFTNVRYERQAGEPAEWTAAPMCAEPFTFSNALPGHALHADFTTWVDASIQVGLDALRRLL